MASWKHLTDTAGGCEDEEKYVEMVDKADTSRTHHLSIRISDGVLVLLNLVLTWRYCHGSIYVVACVQSLDRTLCHFSQLA
jgi:hypothetical protein